MKPRVNVKAFTTAELELSWREGDANMTGPVGPPMLLAMRQPGYLDWLRNVGVREKQPAARPGEQLELAF